VYVVVNDTDGDDDVDDDETAADGKRVDSNSSSSFTTGRNFTVIVEYYISSVLSFLCFM